MASLFCNKCKCLGHEVNDYKSTSSQATWVPKDDKTEKVSRALSEANIVVGNIDEGYDIAAHQVKMDSSQ